MPTRIEAKWCWLNSTLGSALDPASRCRSPPDEPRGGSASARAVSRRDQAELADRTQGRRPMAEQSGPPYPRSHQTGREAEQQPATGQPEALAQPRAPAQPTVLAQL